MIERQIAKPKNCKRENIFLYIRSYKAAKLRDKKANYGSFSNGKSCATAISFVRSFFLF